MFNRDHWSPLQSAAVIVVSTAALVATFVGMPLVMTYYGAHIDVGLIVNAFAALGALAAAVAAVWVATSDRRQAAQQRTHADAAQAALVMIEPRKLIGTAGLDIVVRNYGDRAILNVICVSLDVQGNPQLAPMIPTVKALPIVEPDRDRMQESSAKFIFISREEVNPLLEEALHGSQESNSIQTTELPPATINNETTLTATVRFTDASGNKWESVFDAPARGRRNDDSIRYARRVSLTPLHRMDA
jgi:hypothetical protein